MLQVMPTALQCCTLLLTCLTALPAFGIIILLAREGFESEEISDLAGLNQRSPLYAGVMAVRRFSLAGISFGRFYAKLCCSRSAYCCWNWISHRVSSLCRLDVFDRRLLLSSCCQSHVL